MGLIREKRDNTPKELQELASIYYPTDQVEYPGCWISMMLNQGGWNIRLNKVKFDVGGNISRYKN